MTKIDKNRQKSTKITEEKWFKTNLNKSNELVDDINDLIFLDKIKNAGSTEISKNCTPVIGLIEEWIKDGLIKKGDIKKLGGTMRLGAYPAKLLKDSLVSKIYNFMKYEMKFNLYTINTIINFPNSRQQTPYIFASIRHKFCQFPYGILSRITVGRCCCKGSCTFPFSLACDLCNVNKMPKKPITTSVHKKSYFTLQLLGPARVT